MKEWWVWFEYVGTYEEENLVVLPTFWKLVRWFIVTAHKCDHIEIIAKEVK